VDTLTVATFKNQCKMEQRHASRWAEERKTKFEASRQARGVLPPLVDRPELQSTGLLSVGLTLGTEGFKSLPKGSVTPRAKTSAAERFLDQKMGLSKAPSDAMHEATDLDVLCFGVSAEGLGRSAYLKSRNKLAPQDKFTLSMTSSQAYGWHVDEYESPRKGISFARRPIIQGAFYRPNGVLSKDLNTQFD